MKDAAGYNNQNFAAQIHTSALWKAAKLQRTRAQLCQGGMDSLRCFDSLSMGSPPP